MDGGSAALASHAAILRAAAPAALLKGGCCGQAAGGGSAAPLLPAASAAAAVLTVACCHLAFLSSLRAGASLAGAAVQTALLGRGAGSTALAAYAAVNAVSRPATLLAFSFFVDAAAARLSRALGRRDAATARSQVRPTGGHTLDGMRLFLHACSHRRLPLHPATSPTNPSIQMLLNICCCLLLGCGTAAALLATRQLLFGWMRLQPGVADQAAPLWTLVAAAMPAVLPNLALCGALQARQSALAWVWIPAGRLRVAAH